MTTHHCNKDSRKTMTDEAKDPAKAHIEKLDEEAQAEMKRYPPQTIDRKLLEILVCPLTKATLIYDAPNQELISKPAKRAYPIRDGIPIMLPEEARTMTDEELAKH
jgi:uncharacterized protein YbaR (Trm112 family)